MLKYEKTIEKLKKIDSRVDWNNKLNDLNKSYDDLVNDGEKGVSYYDKYFNDIFIWNIVNANKIGIKKCFELVLENDIKNKKIPNFNGRVEGLPKEEYQIQIIPVGHSIEPIVLSILAVQATEKIIFMCSDETIEYYDWIVKYFKIYGNSYIEKFKLFPGIDSSDPTNIFKEILSIADNYKNKKIAIDITGGKKTMVSGSFTAGAVINCDIFYVDFREYDNDKGTPLPGSEFYGKLESRIGEIFKGIGSYISKEVRENIIKDPKNFTKPERKTLTIFFSDIRSFTSLCDNIYPDEAHALLSEYFDNMVEIIYENKGTVDKFIGDAILAFWGNFKETENDHEIKAVQAAIKMQNKLKELNDKWITQGLSVAEKDENGNLVKDEKGEEIKKIKTLNELLGKAPENIKNKFKEGLKVGMGINTGKVILGNLGSEKFFDYTVIGDAVNVTQRIEDYFEKEYKEGTIWISENTYEKIKNSNLNVKENFTQEYSFIPKGKEKKVKVFNVISD